MGSEPAPAPQSQQAGQGGTTTRFVLVRHGEAIGNRELRYLGATDAPLTERGQRQALQLATALSPFHVTAVYASPLVRARDTAARIASSLSLAVATLDDLREEDFGTWEMLTHTEALARNPEHLAAWEAGESIAPPGGESLLDVQARMIRCADALAVRHPGETVAMVSHVGPIKALVCAALDLPLAGARHIWLDPASICVVDWLPASIGPSSGVVRLFNAIAHLDPPVRWLA